MAAELVALFVDCYKSWEGQACVFPDDIHAYAKLVFLKDKVGVEVQFGHASFIGIDLLKFQIASYANLNNIDFGTYICTARKMQKYLTQNFGHEWEGSLTYEKVINYLPHIKSAIQIPIYVINIQNTHFLPAAKENACIFAFCPL